MLLIPVISLIHIFKKMPVIIWRVKRLNYHVLIKLNFFNTDFCGCFSFGPEPIRSPDIWSPTIGPQEQTVPKQTHFVSMDLWSPRQMVPKIC